jgi:hypothetical protein
MDQRGGTLIIPAPWYAGIGYYTLVCGGIGHYRIPFEGSPFILSRGARGQLGTSRTCLRKSFNMNDDRRPTVDIDGAMRAWY